MIWLVSACTFLVGVLTAWLYCRAEKSRLQTLLAAEQQKAGEQSELTRNLEKKFSDTFTALSYQALQANNKTFLDLADNLFAKYRDGSKQEQDESRRILEKLMTPLRESLTKVDEKIGILEKERVGAYRGLQEQVQSLMEAQSVLRSETISLTNALRSPVVRGRWGELQLRRVVELSGMVTHCDFYEQVSASSEGCLSRPDLLVKLPGNKNIIVDAKAPLKAYLEAHDAADESRRRQLLKEHARLVKSHIQALSQKSYWEQFQPSPEFVVLFLPGENFFSAALKEDPGLIELGADRKVILATPTTLISLLRSVAYGWREEGLAENVREVRKLGQELYGRVVDLASHVNDIGKHLKGAVAAYNKSLGTMESRVLVSLRRFQELNVDDPKKILPELGSLEAEPRGFSRELREGAESS